MQEIDAVKTGVDLMGYVLISEDEYDDLVCSSYMLAQLHEGGVDNWEGYEEALEKDLV